MARGLLPARRAGSGRLWRLDESGEITLDGDAASDILLVPSESILILPVQLPLNTHRERLEALPYAIEDRIVDASDSVHLALSRDRIGDHYLACIVDHALIGRWIEMATAAGLDNVPIVPDALALPVSAQGGWSVATRAERVIVRRPDGSGFACAGAQFPALWAAGGKPERTEMPFDMRSGAMLDLRQGSHAAHDPRWGAVGRKIAIVAAAGIAAHGAIALADTLLLRETANRRGAELLTEIRTKAPGVYNGNDPREAADILSNILPAGGPAPPGRLLPLLAGSAVAMAPHRSALEVKSIAFSEQSGELRYEVDAPEMAVDSARKALADAGLRAGVRISVTSSGIQS